MLACGSPARPPSIAESAKTIAEPAKTIAAPRVDVTKATLTGRVLLDGKPVRVFAVSVRDFAFAPRGRFVRHADGRFAIAGVPPGTHDILIAGPGFAARLLLGNELAAGRVTDLGDIAVRRGHTIEGHVLDTAGKPIDGATVSIERMHLPTLDQTGRWVWGHQTTTTDERGVYRFTDVSRPDISLMSYVIATVDGRMASETRYVPDDSATIDLVVHESGGIDATSEVVGHVSVTAIRGGGRAQFLAPVEGVYHYDNLVPGMYEVYLLPERGVAAPPSQHVAVVAKQRTQVTLAAPATPIRITITAAMPCRVVNLRPAGFGMWRDVAEQTCADGFAEIEGVTPGRYKACDAVDCKTIDVLPSPATQSFDLR